MSRTSSRKDSSSSRRKQSPSGKAAGKRTSKKKIEKLKKALEQKPGDEAAFEKLRDVLAQAESWGPLMDLVQDRLSILKNVDVKVRTLAQIADLFDEKGGDKDPAVELRIAVLLKLARLFDQRGQNEQRSTACYRTVLDLTNGEPTKLISGFRFFGKGEEWHERIAAYLRLIPLAEQPKVKSLLRREIARLYKDCLGDPSSAFFELIRVGRYDPSDPGLIDEIFDMGIASDRLGDLAAVLQEFGSQLPNNSDRARLYTQLARLQLDDLHNANLAQQAIAVALEIDPASVPAQLVRFDLMEANKDFQQLSLALEAFLSRPDLPIDASRDQRKRLARLYEQKLGDRQRAVALFRQSLEEPGPTPAAPFGEQQAALEQVTKKQGAWQLLILQLESRLASSCDPETLGDVALEISEIHESRLGQMDQAFATLLAAAKKAPNHQRLLDALFRLARDRGFLRDCLAAAPELLTNMDAGSSGRMHARVAQLHESEGRIDLAVASYRRALVFDAQEPLALCRLKSLFGSNPDKIPTRVEHRPQQETGSADDYQARAFGTRKETMPTVVVPWKADPATTKSAEEIEHVGESAFSEETTEITNLEEPISELWQQVRAKPDDLSSWEKLAALLQEKHGLPAAFHSFEVGCGLVSSDELRGALFRRMSLLSQSPELCVQLGKLLEQFGRIDDAESSFRTVLRTDAANAEALDGMFRIFEGRHALDRFDAVLSRALKNAKDPKARQALMLRRAHLRAKNLDRVTDALIDLEQIVQADDGDARALSFQEELLEKLGRNDDLVRAYEQHLSRSRSPGERVDLFTAIAILYENRLDNPDQAISHYRKALTEDPSHLGALDSLVSLLEKRSDWLGALEALQAATTSITDPGLRCRMYFRQGKILEEQLLRPEEAEEAYRKAIDGAAPSADALVALRSISRRRGDWVEVIRLGKILREQLTDSSEIARLLVDLARVWRDRLENEDEALDCFEEAHRLDPANLEATRVVAELRLKHRRHEEAHALLAQLAKSGARGEMKAGELSAVYLKLAQSAEAINRLDDAKLAFEEALILSPTDPSVLAQYGYYLARRGDWERAVQLYQDMLNHHGARLRPSEVADVNCLVAQGLLKLSRIEEAAAHYREAIKAFPKHLPAIRAAIDIAEQMGRYNEVVALLRRFRRLATGGPSAHCRLSIQIGDILASNLNRPVEAAKAYREAVQKEPNNVELLEKLWRVLVRAEQIEEAVTIVEHLSGLVANDRLRSRYLRIAGDLVGERLNDDARALEFYLQAAHLSPLEHRTFSSAGKILARLQEWARLATFYEEFLALLPFPATGEEDPRPAILSELAELYHNRLNDPPRAIAAYERLLEIDPTLFKSRAELARLYESESLFDSAIVAHRSLIADSPSSVESYHALRRIYQQRSVRDPCLCLAATLSFLGQADEDEQRLLEEFGHCLPLPFECQVDELLYNQLLLHSGAKGVLGEILKFAAEFCRPLFSVSHKEYKIKARDRLNLSDNFNKLVGPINNALFFLELPPPEFYDKGIQVKGMLPVNTSPIAVLFSGEGMDKATGPELLFMVGRAVAFTRPENLLAGSLSAKQLRTLLEGLAEIDQPRGPVLPLTEEVSSLLPKLENLIPTQERDRLHHLASQYREQAEDLSILDWIESVEHTANRVGFALCGDLSAAVEVLKSARVVSPSGSNRSLIRELIFYSASEEYFELRRAVKAAVG